MYLPTSEACNAASGSQVPSAELTAAAAQSAATSASVNQAQCAFDSTLTRAPSDFASMGSGVAVDVAAVNAATGADRGGGGYGCMTPGGPGGTPGSVSSSSLPARPWWGRGGRYRNRSRSAPTCDVSSSGGCNVIPLNGPGSNSLPQVNAQPVPLRTNQGALPAIPGGPGGLGRTSDARGSRIRTMRARGIGDASYCTDLPPWGDAFPTGGPSANPAQSILDWTAANPLLTLGIAAAGIWIASVAQQKGGKRA